MNFKDVYLDDLNQAFFDTDEFAEKHRVDGREMTICVDNLECRKREDRYLTEDGIQKKRVLFYVRATEFGKLPRAGSRLMKLDGADYNILEAAREGAVYTILLEAVK